MEKEMLQCYNRGCGQKYCPDENNDNACRHHPGEPFFHDAYKGWSCCNKKCTDFTEFLNIKGCTTSKHSNIKPPEPEKPSQDVVIPEEVIQVKPIVKTIRRPPYNTPMTTITPTIAPSLKQQLNVNKVVEGNENESTEIPIGTSCKNGGCNVSYEGPATNESRCIYHPGVPIFHEGLKFWSCCQKRTTDFNAFLNQVGCESGEHLWKKDVDPTKVDCRWDFHQTGTDVVVSIYAKQYCPNTSVIKLNPIRMYVNLLFPQQSAAAFNLDFELCGVIDVGASSVAMYGTKVEIKLKKAEVGTWRNLEVSKKGGQSGTAKDVRIEEELAPKVEGVDIDDLC